MNGAITSAEEIAAVANTCVLYFFCISVFVSNLFSGSRHLARVRHPHRLRHRKTSRLKRYFSSRYTHIDASPPAADADEGGANTWKHLQCMGPSRSRRPQASERLVLIPAINKRSTTGYKNVSYSRRSKKFEARVYAGGKHVHLGYFATAEEAATAYARSEYGRADAAKLLQPRPAPSAAGAEANGRRRGRASHWPPAAAARAATKASATARSRKAARSTS